MGRVLPSVVYIYSLFQWKTELEMLNGGQRVCYHLLAIIATLLNVTFTNPLAAWRKYDFQVFSPNYDDEDGEPACDDIDPRVARGVQLVPVPLARFEENDR